PTGSGKTLAAFLTALDDLFQEGLRAPLPDEVRVVYVSPLKALSADIHKNLAEPRRGIRALPEPPRLHTPPTPAPIHPPHTAAHPRRSPHSRHVAERSRCYAPDAATHHRHDARVALPAADRRAQP